MSDHSPMTDDEITGLLASVADDEAIGAPNRVAIRDRMLAEIDDISTPPLRLVGEDGGPDGSDGPDGRRVSRRRRTASWLVAAASVAVVAGGLLMARSDPEPAPVVSVPLPTVPEPNLLDDSLVPRDLAPGEYESQLAGGVTFELDDPATLEAFGADSLTLGYTTDAGASATVEVVDTDVGAFRSELGRLSAAGDLRVDPAVHRELSFRLVVTDRGAIDRACGASSRCAVDDLGIGLDRDGETILTYAEFGDDRGVVVIERFTGPDVEPPTIARQLVESLRPSDGG